MIVGVWLAAFLAAFPVFFIVTINRVNLPPPDQMARQDNWFGNVTINDLTIRHTEFCALDVTVSTFSDLLRCFCILQSLCNKAI